MRWAGGELPELVGGMLGARPIASSRVAGGDINDSYRLRFEGGLSVFAKTSADAVPGFYAAEAEGLRWLGETATVTVPKVVALRDDPDLAHRFLVLEWIESGPAAIDHDEQLGRALAELHRFPCTRFGAERDNWLATIPLDNRASSTWAEFYATRRLEPLVRQAVDLGRLPTSDVARFANLFEQLPHLVGPDEPPSRLHGDLWSGNVITDRAGRPVLIDPAAYGGHREIDLAMMALFGGFGAAVLHAYDECHPRAVDHERRVALYQLLPLLVHTVLVGGGYASSVRRALAQYVS